MVLIITFLQCESIGYRYENFLLAEYTNEIHLNFRKTRNSLINSSDVWK